MNNHTFGYRPFNDAESITSTNTASSTNSHSHSHSILQQTENHHKDAMNTGCDTTRKEADGGEGEADLEHALLETLFYNEMMMLGDGGGSEDNRSGTNGGGGNIGLSTEEFSNYNFPPLLSTSDCGSGGRGSCRSTENNTSSTLATATTTNGGISLSSAVPPPQHQQQLRPENMIIETVPQNQQQQQQQPPPSQSNGDHPTILTTPVCSIPMAVSEAPPPQFLPSFTPQSVQPQQQQQQSLQQQQYINGSVQTPISSTAGNSNTSYVPNSYTTNNTTGVSTPLLPQNPPVVQVPVPAPIPVVCNSHLDLNPHPQHHEQPQAQHHIHGSAGNIPIAVARHPTTQPYWQQTQTQQQQQQPPSIGVGGNNNSAPLVSLAPNQQQQQPSPIGIVGNNNSSPLVSLAPNQQQQQPSPIGIGGSLAPNEQQQQPLSIGTGGSLAPNEQQQPQSSIGIGGNNNSAPLVSLAPNPLAVDLKPLNNHGNAARNMLPPHHSQKHQPPTQQQSHIQQQQQIQQVQRSHAPTPSPLSQAHSISSYHPNNPQLVATNIANPVHSHPPQITNQNLAVLPVPANSSHAPATFLPSSSSSIPSIVNTPAPSSLPLSTIQTNELLATTPTPSSAPTPASNTTTINSASDTKNQAIIETDSDRHKITAVQQQKAKQLVNQFATLASRLGISLPKNVLNNLTAAAAIDQVKEIQQQQQFQAQQNPDGPAQPKLETQEMNKTERNVTSSTTVPEEAVGNGAVLINTTESNNLIVAKESDNKTQQYGSPTLAKELQRTAEEAIATVQERKKRPRSEGILNTQNDNMTNLTSTSSMTPNSYQEGDKVSTLIAVPTTQPSLSSRSAHYRRKKKPRLEDCEIKLAQLKAESDMLKRHLDNVTNKTARFENERKAVEKQMRDMVNKYNDAKGGNNSDSNKNGIRGEQICVTNKSKNNSPTSSIAVIATKTADQSQIELHKLIKKFTETYSDYGRHRQQELTFHLTQLEKLAAPTTFTKMSLWTLGQKESFFTKPQHNPIAGILRKELNITPIQGRKILNQREKIQRLCQNIKQCITLIAKLKSLCEYKQRVFNGRMTKCQEILTPVQVVKLLIWIDDHSEVLERVCPGWGSERIVAGARVKVDANTSASTADLVGNKKNYDGIDDGGCKNTNDAGTIGCGADSSCGGDKSVE